MGVIFVLVTAAVVVLKGRKRTTSSSSDESDGGHVCPKHCTYISNAWQYRTKKRRKSVLEKRRERELLLQVHTELRM